MSDVQIWIWILFTFFVNNSQAFHNTDASKIRVLCWVMTHPSAHEKTMSTKITWAKRCDQILYFSTIRDESLGTIELYVSEGRENLWNKVRSAFEYIYENHKGSYDWVMKADPDTYVIVENLKRFLSYTDPTMPIYYGCKFKLPPHGPVYMSGGSGYVLSREAVRRFVERGIYKKVCPEEEFENEDVKIGECMNKLLVEAGDSRDQLKRERFLPLGIEAYRGKVKDDYWYWKYLYYPSTLGYECCSETPISFHYVTPSEMFALEYYLYHVRVQKL